jgi:hypothetical protein
MITDGADVVAATLIDAVAPASVLDVGSDGTWAAAFKARGVNDVESSSHDLRSPLVFDRRFDLAVCTGVADHLPPDVVPTLISSLVRAASVVAFAAALPGVEPSENSPARWPAWWDSLFEQHGYEVHDLVRWNLWDDQRVDLVVRNGLVVYAPAGRFEPVPVPPSVARAVVHPEAHHRALYLAGRRLDAEARSANMRLAELDAAVSAAEEQLRLTASDLDVARAQVAQLEQLDEAGDIPALQIQLVRAENEAAKNRSDAVLLWSALANAQRELAAASTVGLPSFSSVRTAPKRQLVRFVTAALPLRRGFRRILGPPARLFDEHWYVSRYPDVAESALSPLWHYRRHGRVMRRSPVPLFDPLWYVERNPDVAESGVDPLDHYLKTGWREGRDPHPVFSNDWYVRQVGPRRWRRSPLEHYLRHGRGEGASPHPLIDTAYYLADNLDIALAGVDPVDHFLVRGWWEGRSPHRLFDVRWYLQTYLDVASTGENPFVQYLRQGWREGRDPNPLFDVSWYLDANPDVAEAGVEPLGHYLASGAAEGRATGPLFDTAWYVASHPDAALDGRNPLAFFFEIGAARGDSPSPWADELASEAVSGRGQQRFGVESGGAVPRVLL